MTHPERLKKVPKRFLLRRLPPAALEAGTSDVWIDWPGGPVGPHITEKNRRAAWRRGVWAQAVGGDPAPA